MSAIPESVLQLIEKFKGNADHYRSPSYNEETCRIDFINPMFEALGWDMGNRDGWPTAFTASAVQRWGRESLPIAGYPQDANRAPMSKADGPPCRHWRTSRQWHPAEKGERYGSNQELSGET